ncbi:hypothetical protein IRJ41_021963, partial [Triplophysa rosa]
LQWSVGNDSGRLTGGSTCSGVVEIYREVTHKYRLRIKVTGDPAVDLNDPDIRNIIELYSIRLILHDKHEGLQQILLRSNAVFCTHFVSNSGKRTE